MTWSEFSSLNALAGSNPTIVSMQFHAWNHKILFDNFVPLPCMVPWVVKPLEKAHTPRKLKSSVQQN